jgi:tetratricopeptide (TPR) repeat protein
VIQNRDVKMLLYRARLLVEEGQYDTALELLVALQPEEEKQRQDVLYLLGWCYVQCKRWEDALKTLSPLLIGMDERFDVETLQERERHAMAFLRLGVAAVNLSSYEDASFHFTHCLKVLHDRRVHLPVVRIHARYYLAMTCLMRGLNSLALEYYEEAIQLCHHYADETALPDIYYGLCDVYRATDNLAQAYIAGKEALRLYELHHNQQLVARMHNMLGQVSFLQENYRDASDHYTESLAIATNYSGPVMCMRNCGSLAELRLAEGRVEEAKRYCQLALKSMDHTEDAHMQGRVYHVIAKVTYEESRCTNGAGQKKKLEETVLWYEKARGCLATTQAYADVADVYGGWALALEELGRVTEAIDCWREGYAVLHQPKTVAL